MHNKKTKCKTSTRNLEKSKKRFTAYSETQWQLAYILEKDNEIKEIRPNVLIDIDLGSFTTDFLCVKEDDSYVVYECVLKKNLFRPSVLKLLDASRNYWSTKGVDNFVLVLGVKDEDK